MTEPSVNGKPLDLHSAAESLYQDLLPYWWFRAIEVDSDANQLIVEAKDEAAAQQRLPVNWHGYGVVARKGGLVWRPVVVKEEDAQEMIA